MINFIFCAALYVLWIAYGHAGAGNVLLVWLWVYTVVHFFIALPAPDRNYVRVNRFQQKMLVFFGMTVFVGLVWVEATVTGVVVMFAAFLVAAYGTVKK